MDGPYHRVGGGHEPAWIVREYPCPASCQIDTIWDVLHDSIRLGKRFPITIEQSLEVMRVIARVRKGTRFDTLAIHRGV